MKSAVRRLYRAALGALCLAARVVLARSAARRPYDPATVRRMLVMRFGLMGDAAQLTPTLRLLRQSFPQAEIHVIAPPIQAEVLATQPYADRLVVWKAGDLTEPRRALSWPAWRDAARVIFELRRSNYDVALSCYGALGSAVALLSGAPHRFGFRSEALPGTLTHGVAGTRWLEPGWHEAGYSLAVARAAGAVGESPETLLVVPDDAREAACGLLLPGRQGASGPLVLLHAGATNGDAKRWPAEYWSALARRLVEDGAAVALVGGPDDQALAAEIVAAARVPLTNLVGKTSVSQLLAVLACAGLVVSGDSGPLHLAVAVGAPVVAIHGPTDPAVNGPFMARNASIVRHPLPCAPCYRLDRVADCPLGHTLCQWLVPPDAVYAAVRRRLEASRWQAL